ncbi:hypothetical protein OG21DRAFT_1506755 [Imleria badia]|nr:hypothetical protein OG21DRAFT_1506755 [Imleria badia]
MVFTKLSVQEKDAFFGLLDEYFQSRPELLGHGGGQGSGLAGTGIPTAAAASVVQRALAANTTGSTGGASGALSKSNNPYAALTATANSADVAHAVSVGRVAAASFAFSGGAPSSSSSASASPSPFSQLQHAGNAFAHAGLKPPAPADAPPSLPRRAAAEQTGSPGSEVDKLVTRKTSVFSSFKKPPSAGVVIPSAFVAPKGTFGPPPVRRTTSEASTGAGVGTGTTPRSTSAIGTRAAQREVAPPPEEEVAEGEWAEVLYDYSSEDPGDLAIEAGMRVFVTAKSSDDWWTGQVEGQEREGLFPASYVKLL